MRYIILLVVCILGLTPGLATIPPMDRDESRFGQATKQMAETGDYIDIHFQEEKRYKKPIGVYWLQAAALKISGLDDRAPIWTYRIVSVLGIAMAVLATCWVGSRLFGQRAGLVAGLALAATFAVAFEGRTAKTDAALLAFSVLAQGALAQIYVNVREGRTVAPHLPWLFWAAQGCGILIKGPITPLASLLTVAALYVLRRDLGWLKATRPLAGLALTALIVLPWLVLITFKSGLAFWHESIGNDLLGKVTGGAESHGLPPGFYALTYSLYLWPFGLLALGGGLRAWNAAKDDFRIQFLLAWYLSLWLFFELVPTKLPNYVIPAYPALLLLFGWVATLSHAEANAALKRWQIWLWRLAAFGQVAVTLGLASLAIALPLYLEDRLMVTGLVAAALLLFAGLAAFPRGITLPLRRVAVSAGAALVGFGVLFGAVFPSLSTIWLSPRIVAAVEAGRRCDEGRLAAAGFHEPSLVFLAGTTTLLTDVGGAAAHLLSDPDCALALVPTGDGSRLAEIVAADGRVASSISTIRGINYSSGDRLSLTLFRISN